MASPFLTANATVAILAWHRMTSNRFALAAILKQHLALYREMSHSELAARLESSRHGDQLDVTAGQTADGEKYTIETSILWDDRPKRHIRVISDLTTNRRGCLFGIIPIFRPDVVGGFILKSDGTSTAE